MTPRSVLLFVCLWTLACTDDIQKRPPADQENSPEDMPRPQDMPLDLTSDQDMSGEDMSQEEMSGEDMPDEDLGGETCDGLRVDEGEACDDGTEAADETQLDGCSACSITEFLVANGNGAHPRPYVLGPGRYTIFWGSFDVYAQMYEVGTSVASPSVTLKSGPGNNGIRVARGADSAVVTWDAQDFGDSTIRARMYTPNGLRETTIVSAGRPGDAKLPSPASLEDGTFVIAWNHRAEGQYHIVARRYDAQFQPLGEFMEIATNTSRGRPAVTSLAGGGFQIAWTAPDAPMSMKTHIQSRRYRADGSMDGDLVIITESPSTHDSLKLVSQPESGGFAALWYDRDAALMRGRIYNQATVMGPAFDVGPGGWGSIDAVGVPGGGLLATVYLSDQTQMFSATNRVYRLSAQGEVLGEPIVVNKNSFAESQGPGIDVFPDGSFIVAWRDGNRRVFAQRFSATGERLYR